MARRGLLNEFSRPNHGTPPQMHCSVSAMGRFMAAPRRAEGAISSSTPHTGHVSATPGHSLVGLYVIRMYSNCRQACRNFCAGPRTAHSRPPGARVTPRVGPRAATPKHKPAEPSPLTQRVGCVSQAKFSFRHPRTPFHTAVSQPPIRLQRRRVGRRTMPRSAARAAENTRARCLLRQPSLIHAL